MPNLKLSLFVAAGYPEQNFFMKYLISRMQPMNFTSHNTNDTDIAAAGAPILFAACPKNRNAPDTNPSAAPETPALLQTVLAVEY